MENINDFIEKQMINNEDLVITITKSGLANLISLYTEQTVESLHEEIEDLKILLEASKSTNSLTETNMNKETTESLVEFINENPRKRKKEYEIGDVVKIKDHEHYYSTYHNKFNEMTFKEINGERPAPSYKTTYTIFAKSMHGLENIYVYGIEDSNGNQHLVNRKAIKLIKK